MLLQGLHVLFSEILRVWLNMIKFCHYLTKPIITRIIVSLLFENVVVRTAVLFSEKILSLFNQAHYYTNYCVFSV